MAALAALWRRQRTGQGAYIDVAASDAHLANSWIAAVTNLNYDKITDLTGMAPRGQANDGWPAGSVYYALYEAKDAKHMMFCAIEPKFWRNFCDAIGREDLRGEINDRLAVDYGIDRQDMRAVLADIFRTRTSAEWTQLALDHNIPMAVSNTLDQVPSDPHNHARGILVEGEHPVAGPFTYLRYPAIIDGGHSQVLEPAPQLGEHTEAVLSALGLSPAEIAAAQVLEPRRARL